jgi:hypothetical protein
MGQQQAEILFTNERRSVIIRCYECQIDIRVQVLGRLNPLLVRPRLRSCPFCHSEIKSWKYELPYVEHKTTKRNLIALRTNLAIAVIVAFFILGLTLGRVLEAIASWLR